MKREFKARLILASALIGGFAFAAEPRITLSAENQPLGQVLQSIEKQSGFSVVLNDKKWSEDIVTLSVKNLELEKALGVVFGGYNFVLAFEADKGEVSKVLVTVYEKKEGVAMPILQGSLGSNLVPSQQNMERSPDFLISEGKNRKTFEQHFSTNGSITLPDGTKAEVRDLVARKTMGEYVTGLKKTGGAK